MPLTVDAPDRPAAAAEWLVTIGTGGGTIRVGSNARIVGGETYLPGLLGAPRLVHRLDDVLYAFTERSGGDIAVSNHRGDLSGLWTTDRTGQDVTITRYDWIANVSVTEFTGIVDGVSVEGDRVIIAVVNHDLAALDELVPATLVTTDLYGTACPDAGAVEQKVIGNPDRIWLPYVLDDVPGDQFWYLVSVGTGGYTVANVVRDTIGEGQFEALAGSEYELRTDLVAGRTLLRTFVRQRKAGGGFHRLYADVTSPGGALERQPARVWRNLLSDATWGLGQTINATSFDAAEAIITALPRVHRLDCVLATQRPAREWAKWILPLRGMRANRGPSGWELTVDTAAATAKMAIGAGVGAQQQNMLSAGRLLRPTLDERIATLRVRYRPNNVTGDLLLRAADRTVAAVGKKLKVKNPLLRSNTTADAFACYWGKRLKYYAIPGRIDGLRVSEEGRALAVGDVVQVTAAYAAATLTAQDMKIVEIEKTTNIQTISAVGYDPDIYVDEAGTLPTVPVVDQGILPPAPTAFTVDSSGTKIAPDQHVVAWFKFSVTIPVVAMITGTRLDYRVNGETAYGNAQVIVGTGVQIVRVGGLVPGESYDVRATTLSGKHECAVPATLTNQTAPGDATVAATPATPTIIGQHGKEITFGWATAAEAKRYEWDVRTASGGGGSLVTSGSAAIGIVMLSLSGLVSYGVTRYFRVRAVKATAGLESAYSASVAFTLSAYVTDDIGDDQITTPKIPAGAITQGAQNAVDTAVVLTGSDQTIMSLNLTAQGGTIFAVATGYLTWAGGGSISTVALTKLRRSGGPSSPDQLVQLPGGTEFVSIPFTCVLFDAPGIGTFTYEIRSRKTTLAADVVVCHGLDITILEFRR